MPPCLRSWVVSWAHGWEARGFWALARDIWRTNANFSLAFGNVCSVGTRRLSPVCLARLTLAFSSMKSRFKGLRRRRFPDLPVCVLHDSDPIVRMLIRQQQPHEMAIPNQSAHDADTRYSRLAFGLLVAKLSRSVCEF